MASLPLRPDPLAPRRRTRPLPPLLGIASDALFWVVTVLFLTVTRLIFATDALPRWSTILLHATVVAVLCAAAMLVAGWFSGLHRRRYIAGSLDELSVLAGIDLVIALIAAAGILVTGTIPRSVAFALFPVALVLTAAPRVLYRLSVEKRVSPSRDSVPVILVGAGDLGHIVARQIMSDPHSEYRPVGFIDDDPSKHGFVINRLRVLGGRKDLARIAENTRAEGLLVCIAGTDASWMREMKEEADQLGLRMLVFPSFNDAVNNRLGVRSLRDVSVDDLVGRNPAKIDLSAVASYLTGKRVLVTGAGGSIGSELCRQIHSFGPSELLMLDRDESGLHTTQMSIYGHGLLNSPDMILADIRDARTLNEVFAKHRPEVVFHTAALKHLPMLEQYPREGWQTNVLGTLNVLQAALSVDVERFVNISTDKAADPTSILGYSKRMAEHLTAWAATRSEGLFVSVRFGNVLGSRGSVLPTFQAQIERGGPVTITHPEVTRYFMTIPEACELVVQAGAIGRDGEVMILDMGEPMSILAVARRMIDMADADVEIKFTGLREGEKLHEDLFSRDESHDRPFHPRISHTGVDATAPDTIDYDTWLSHVRTRQQEKAEAAKRLAAQEKALEADAAQAEGTISE